jgi:hypothetical protein
MSKYILSALLGTVICATAQNQAPPVPTNQAVVKVLPATPNGFDAVTAAPQDLQRYGIPPKPDQVQNPKLFSVWQKAVTGKANVQPTVVQTQIYHKPARLKEALAKTPQAPAGGTNPAAYTYNWSGSAVYDPSNPFRISYILAYWTVPFAQQAFGTSNGTWAYSSQWVGIDGFANSDVMQAGTEADAYSDGSSNSSFYSFWIEWFPYAESRISGFPVTSGDIVFVEVWNTSPTQGYAYLANLSTNQAAGFSLTSPPGTQLQGSSAEWVVERPEVNSSLAPLTNYVADSFAFCAAAASYTRFYYPGYVPSGTAYELSMLDNYNNVISVPALTGLQSIWFWDEGSAR